MILSSIALMDMARLISKIVNRDESLRAEKITKIHLCWHEDGHPVLTVWQAEKYRKLKTYDHRHKEMSRMAIAEDIVETVRSAGHELEVQWDE